VAPVIEGFTPLARFEFAPRGETVRRHSPELWGHDGRLAVQRHQHRGFFRDVRVRLVVTLPHRHDHAADEHGVSHARRQEDGDENVVVTFRNVFLGERGAGGVEESSASCISFERLQEADLLQRVSNFAFMSFPGYNLGDDLAVQFRSAK